MIYLSSLCAPPEPGRRNKYCEYVFTLHRKLHRRRMKYNLFKMLAFLNIHLCELSSNFILAPEVSDTGKLHIHAIVQIDEDTARFKIFKGNIRNFWFNVR